MPVIRLPMYTKDSTRMWSDFTDALPLEEIDVLFFCTAHGDTKKFIESHNIPEDLKIIWSSMDYRIASPDHDFIYGLPELNRRATCTAKHVANPGCFCNLHPIRTSSIGQTLDAEWRHHGNAITGSTGAGVKHRATSHFSWRNNNMRCVQSLWPPTCTRNQTIAETTSKQFRLRDWFYPLTGVIFPRGIFATLVVKPK